MKKIRHSVYETNSSSSHSISITSNTKLNDIPLPDSEGNIYLYSREFGWEQETYNDFSWKDLTIKEYYDSRNKTNIT